MEQFLSLQINDYFVAVFFWNILLALIPCFIVFRMANGFHLKGWTNIGTIPKWSFVGLFLIWFFFFPNTAYLFSDIRHLANYCDQLDAMRICPNQAYLVPIFLSYAMVGIPTFYYGLSKMSYVLSKLFGAAVGRIFPVLMIPLTALGVMIGLVDRFNSWDIVFHPFSIVKIALAYFLGDVMSWNLLSYTLMLYGIYYFIKLTKQK